MEMDLDLKIEKEEKRTLKEGRAEEEESQKENPNRHWERAHERKETQGARTKGPIAGYGFKSRLLGQWIFEFSYLIFIYCFLSHTSKPHTCFFFLINVQIITTILQV